MSIIEDNRTSLYWPFPFFVYCSAPVPLCSFYPSLSFPRVFPFVYGVICGAIWQEGGLGYWILLQASVVLT